MFVLPLGEILQHKANREVLERNLGRIENQPANPHPALSNLQNGLTEKKVSEAQ